MSINKISFLGLGVMGFPMAEHLSKKSGAAVTVYNRTEAKADKWLSEYEGTKALTPAEAAKDMDVICLCVGNDDDLRNVLTGENGVHETVKEGAIIVDHTTVSADVSREMAEYFKAKNVVFLDAPVSGGEAGAVNGQLTIMVGGDKAAYDVVAPIFKEVYAREIRHMGDSGYGQLTKMVNQMCIAGALQGLSEGLAFGMKSGLDCDEVLGVISKGSATSWQMENRGSTMIRDEFDFGFAVDWIYKDLGIALDEAKKNGAELPLMQMLHGFYKELSDQGHGRCDASSLIKRLVD